MTVLVIDIGSSSVRALLFDDQARPIPEAAASSSHQISTIPPGAAILDVLDLQARTEACIDEVLKHPASKDIHVVAMATLAGNILGLDYVGNPLTPIYTYADTRCAEDVLDLKSQVIETGVHQRTGCLLHTAYLPGRLHWLKRVEPELFDAIGMWLDFGTYLYTQWFGRTVCSFSVASWNGLFNRSTLNWDEEWLELLQLNPSTLPPLADYPQSLRKLSKNYTTRWPVLKDTPFCLAVGDGVAANVGSGCVDESCISLTVGTTAALRVISSATLPYVPEGLWSYRVDQNLHLIGGATSEGGNIFHWALETLKLENLEALENTLTKHRVDSHGLTFLPLLAGERSPGWATNATGAIIGLRLSTTPTDIIQAAMEGVALRLALVAEQVSEVAYPDARIIGSGGALVASHAWAQIITNALNRPLHVAEENEITARGTAILALRAIGQSELSDHPLKIAYTLEPQPENVKLMQVARERQAEIYQKLVGSAS